MAQLPETKDLTLVFLDSCLDCPLYFKGADGDGNAGGFPGLAPRCKHPSAPHDVFVGETPLSVLPTPDAHDVPNPPRPPDWCPQRRRIFVVMP